MAHWSISKLNVDLSIFYDNYEVVDLCLVHLTSSLTHSSLKIFLLETQILWFTTSLGAIHVLEVGLTPDISPIWRMIFYIIIHEPCPGLHLTAVGFSKNHPACCFRVQYQGPKKTRNWSFYTHKRTSKNNAIEYSK